jgi:hypothetical protein
VRAGATGGTGPPVRDGRQARPAPAGYALSVVLLAAAFVALLWVPSYAHLEPSLGGIPFFYWYSLLWLVLNAGCQAAAYGLLVTAPRRRATRASSAGTTPAGPAGRGGGHRP